MWSDYFSGDHMRYLPHTDNNISEMLGVIGKESLDSLFSSIPSNLRLKRKLDLPEPHCELQIKKKLKKLAVPTPALSFLGAGATAHFVPEIVSQLLLRSEWYTAYTPYQPEASQGTLQAMFEFQTMVASIFGCDIANASMYDGATALVEALLMSKRLKPKSGCVILARSIHPEYREICATYLRAAEIDIVEAPIDLNGRLDLLILESLASKHSGQIAAIAYQTPNFFGQLENQKDIVELGRKHGCLVIGANSDPMAFGAIRSPGEFGADIVVGEGLGLCGHLSLGGPGVGLFACSKAFVRQMPGRLVGATTDGNNQRGFVLALSTREQHIRRERATSNICTNHGLMALAFSIALSLYGRVGFREAAKSNIKRTMYFRRKATDAGLNIAFDGPHFNETVLRFSSEKELQRKLDHLAEDDILAGCKLSRWYPEMEGHLLVSTTEIHTDDELDSLAVLLSV